MTLENKDFINKIINILTPMFNFDDDINKIDNKLAEIREQYLNDFKISKKNKSLFYIQINEKSKMIKQNKIMGEINEQLFSKYNKSYSTLYDK